MAKLSNNQKLSALSLGYKFLALLERVLPAFLVAWNNQLRQRNKKLELTLEKKELEEKIEDFSDHKNKDKKDAKTIINNFLKS